MPVSIPPRKRCDLLIANAGELIVGQGVTPRRGDDLRNLSIIKDGAIAITDGVIVALGATADLARDYQADRTIDAGGNLVSPGFVDPHTHLVHAGSRHVEWERMATGQGFGGLETGIMYTVNRTRAEEVEVLRDRALGDLDEMLAHGTTTVELKSGYGLDRTTELKLLDVANDLEHPIDIVSTYLGAHVLPAEYAGNREGFVDLVVSMLPEAAKRAQFCDVCCDPVGFTPDECQHIAEEAKRLGMDIKVHGDQTGNGGGAELAVELGAVSVDHVDAVDEAGIAALANSDTVAVILPGVTHHMLETTPPLSGQSAGTAMYTDRPDWARRLVEANVALALSTDFNPGSCYSLSMQAMMQLAARMYRLGYAEIWNMATINAAAAIGRADSVGSLEVGKKADVVLWRVPEHGMVINRFGSNLVSGVVKDGVLVLGGGASQ